MRWKRKLGSHNKGVWAELEQAVCLSKEQDPGAKAGPVTLSLGVGGGSSRVAPPVDSSPGS